MTRTGGIVALVAVALIAMSAVEADAHYTIVSGKLVYHSVDCEAFLKGVANPDPEDPARVVCAVTNVLVATLCENPTNHNVAPGQAGLQTVIIGETPDGAFQFQGKGKAVATVPEFYPACPDNPEPGDECFLGLTNDVCVNPNWHLINVLVRGATLQITTETCNDKSNDPTPGCQTTFSVASVATYQCTLSDEFGFDAGQVFPPPPGTEYSCSQTSVQHVQ